MRALAQALSLPHARVQFTPDMMPSDITGHAVLDPSTRELRIVRGPVFTHVLLADEINRAPAKTQSALLEVMQEYQVTLEGQTLPLPKPFMVLATQNPVETEGTYPLPEAQLDRFLFKIEIGYPSSAEEVAVVVRATADQAGDELPLADVKPCLDGAARLDAAAARRAAARRRAGVDYAVRIVRATRDYAGPRDRQRLARRPGAGARRPRGGAARRPRLRDARRHQAHRAAGAAPPRRAGAGCAARGAHGQRPADRRHRDRRRAARSADDLRCHAVRVIPGRTGVRRARGAAGRRCARRAAAGRAGDASPRWVAVAVLRRAARSPRSADYARLAARLAPRRRRR